MVFRKSQLRVRAYAVSGSHEAQHLIGYQPKNRNTGYLKFTINHYETTITLQVEPKTLFTLN